MSMRLNGAVIAPTSHYRVTVNSFLAAGGDEFYVLREGTERVTGMLDLDALEAWFAAHAPSVPATNSRIHRLN